MYSPEITINAIVRAAHGDDAVARILIAHELGQYGTQENVNIVLVGVYRSVERQNR